MKNLFLSLAVIATLTVVSCKEKAAEGAEGTEVVSDSLAPTEEVTEASTTTEVATTTTEVEVATETK